MVRGTTPNFILRIDSDKVDLTRASNVYVSIRQDQNYIEITGESLEISTDTVECYLTQTQSLSLSEKKPAKIQINWTVQEQDRIKRLSTKTKEIDISEQLLKREIE